MTEDEMYTLMDAMEVAFYYPHYFSNEIWLVEASNLDKKGKRIDSHRKVFIPNPPAVNKLEAFEKFTETNGLGWING